MQIFQQNINWKEATRDWKWTADFKRAESLSGTALLGVYLSMASGESRMDVGTLRSAVSF